MKKLVLFSLLAIGLPSHFFAQGLGSERQDLHDLIELRRKKFDAYSYSLEKKSGFFGNKTKKDMQHSIDVLSGIVETDNRIISVLNHVVDFRNYEKVNNTYDLHDRNEEVQNLQRATDTLTKQLDAIAISNAVLKSKSRKFRWSFYLVSLALVWMIIQNRRKKSA